MGKLNLLNNNCDVYVIFVLLAVVKGGDVAADLEVRSFRLENCFLIWQLEEVLFYLI